ncbi:MAG: hypothetical protein RUMPE_00933 [Eubacteriales bacterium SKADARSKE-1]|nr:hypothetical protein [Eubacteriales bacterium SKADARSKE-1]
MGKFAGTYLWILSADDIEKKTLKVRTIGGYETTVFFIVWRCFQKNMGKKKK